MALHQFALQPPSPPARGAGVKVQEPRQNRPERPPAVENGCGAQVVAVSGNGRRREPAGLTIALEGLRRGTLPRVTRFPRSSPPSAPQVMLYNTTSRKWSQAALTCNPPYVSIDRVAQKLDVGICHLTQFGVFTYTSAAFITGSVCDRPTYDRVLNEVQPCAAM